MAAPMSQPYEIYCKGIKKKLMNYWAAWRPDTHYELGDFGIIKGYVFEKKGSLDELKIKFKSAEDKSPSPLEIISSSDVSINFKVAGEVNEAFVNVPEGEAGLKIDFGSKGAFIIQSPETFEPSIDTQMKLEKSIIDLFKKGEWQADWAIIVRIVQAPLATIIISNSESAGLEFSAKTNLSAGLADLGKADLGLTFRVHRGDIIRMTQAENVTPFFQLARLKRRLFGLLAPTSLEISRKASPVYSILDIASSTSKAQLENLYLDVLRDEEIGEG
jgi:hypothetical protein